MCTLQTPLPGCGVWASLTQIRPGWRVVRGRCQGSGLGSRTMCVRRRLGPKLDVCRADCLLCSVHGRSPQSKFASFAGAYSGTNSSHVFGRQSSTRFVAPAHNSDHAPFAYNGHGALCAQRKEAYDELMLTDAQFVTSTAQHGVEQRLTIHDARNGAKDDMDKAKRRNDHIKRKIKRNTTALSNARDELKELGLELQASTNALAQQTFARFQVCGAMCCELLRSSVTCVSCPATHRGVLPRECSRE